MKELYVVRCEGGLRAPASQPPSLPLRSHEPSDRGDSGSNSKDVPVTTNSREAAVQSAGHHSDTTMTGAAQQY